MLKQSEIINELSIFLTNYEECKESAIKLEWISIEEEHVDWYKNYPLGIMVDVLRFPKDYVSTNLKNTYIRCILSIMAYNEEWEQDFWNISEEKRHSYLKASEANNQNVYRTYFGFRELRLKQITSNFLVQEIQYYARSNNIAEIEIKKYSDLIENALCIELGGSYAGDHTYLAIKEDMMVFVACGVWD